MSKINNAIINMDFYPMISKTEIAARSKYQISFEEMQGIGSAFGIIAAEFAKVAKEGIGANADGGQGLYHCVFPNGVTGKLAKFKDGSGFLGTIMNNGIEAQARWIPAEGGAAALAINPVTIAVAVAIVSINHKLDVIQKTQDEILEFLNQDKETKLEGDLNLLSGILKDYKYNSEDKTWLGSMLTNATAVRGRAEQNILFYKKRVQSVFEDMKGVHFSGQDTKLSEKINKAFKYYQLGIYLYAYASFLQVLLGGNYKKDFLDHVYKEIKERSFEYQSDYSKCYTALEDYLKGSLDAIALKGIGAAGKGLGNAIGRIPVVRKGPVDEALVAAGETLKSKGAKPAKEAMEEFRINRDAGIRLFTENIETINLLCNQPVDMLFDDSGIYLCA